MLRIILLNFAICYENAGSAICIKLRKCPVRPSASSYESVWFEYLSYATKVSDMSICHVCAGRFC